MRILTTLTYYRPHYSGLTIYAERVARSLASRGHHITVLTSKYDDLLQSREMQGGVQIIRLRVLFRISKGVIMPGMLPTAYKIIRDADIVHLHVPQLDAAPVSLLSKLLKKPIVLTYHCDLQLPAGFIHTIANKFSNLANHITANSADTIVTNTLDYANNSPFLSRYINKVHQILPPIELTPINKTDLSAFRDKYNIAPEQNIIGMAARLVTEKGVEYLARALPKVLEQFPNARVFFVGPYQNIIGEGNYTRSLMPIIDQLGDHWSFLGILSPVEMSAFFHECEVTVLPSINSTESYGMVQVESMISGTPVVCSNLPGVRVPVEMTGMGKVVPAANSNQLASAIIDLLSQPTKYKGNLEAITIPSDPDFVAGEYEKIFHDLIYSSHKSSQKMSRKTT